MGYLATKRAQRERKALQSKREALAVSILSSIEVTLDRMMEVQVDDEAKEMLAWAKHMLTPSYQALGALGRKWSSNVRSGHVRDLTLLDEMMQGMFAKLNERGVEITFGPSLLALEMALLDLAHRAGKRGAVQGLDMILEMVLEELLPDPESMDAQIATDTGIDRIDKLEVCA